MGFISRPVGAALFGHYGDRIGRKATLIATLLLTGLSTFAVGFVPGYASIGIWGAVILTVVRFIQGMGIGGEWGGATLVAMEWAKTNAHRGFITSWPQWGGPAGLFLANIAVLVFSAISGDQFLVWGWRVPFWISIVMVAVGLWIRLGVLETPVFKRIVEEEKVARAPVLEVLRRQPKEIVLTALCRMAEQGPFYVYAAFVFTYGTTVLHQPRNFLLTALMCATGLSAVTIPLSGYISDRIGRKRMYLIGAATMGTFAFVYFALLNSAIPAVIFIAIILSFIPHDMMYGPQAALIAECFTRGCATAAPRSASTCRRSSPAGRRRSSPPPSWRAPGRAIRSRSTSRSAPSSASPRRCSCRTIRTATSRRKTTPPAAPLPLRKRSPARARPNRVGVSRAAAPAYRRGRGCRRANGPGGARRGRG